mmetsp:Transcript_12726/g.20844  ORF Transcript_12726/g.20844 Transcript_12726/m.20844 type:complete len:112 (-) Transcript_12726:501-836(-)
MSNHLHSDEFLLSTPLLQNNIIMNELRNEEEGLSNPSLRVNEPNANEQLMTLAASFDNNDASAPSYSKYSPMNLLSFCKERTIEHFQNISISELSGSLGAQGQIQNIDRDS